VGKEKDPMGPDEEIVEEVQGADQASDAPASDKVVDDNDRYLRLVAEFDNYRKRTEREMAAFKRRAADEILMAVLEVVDNLDRAMESADGCDPPDLAEGLKAIRGQMAALLQREGIEAIETVGTTFDPYEMEAVMKMPSEDVEEGCVVRELQRGYRGRGYILRPSKVIVSGGPPEQMTGGKPSDKDNETHRK
jgi:molecular chaperone GrpE